MSTLSVIGLVLITFSVYYGARTYESFVRNLSAAKGSNIPYIVVPIYWLNPLWRITQPLCMPVLRRLPLRWTDPWLSVIEENWTWTSRYAIFERLGTDTFLTVSPGGNTLYLANASVINEITSRRTDFPKPIQDYKLLEIYGRSLVSSEGQVWKQHRKIAGALFTEKSNHTVWAESIQQTQAILKYWIEDSGLKSSTIYTVEEDTMRLSLHVISRVGFGVHLPMTPAKHENGINSEGSYNPIDQSSRVGQPESGHKMTYADAINIVLCDIMWILVIPRFLLSQSPKFNRVLRIH